MNEFFYTKQIISHPLSEEDENLGKKPEWREAKAKVSLKNIQCIYESTHGSGVECVCIDYHDDSYQVVIDDFERICELHDQYLKTTSNEKIRLN